MVQEILLNQASLWDCPPTLEDYRASDRIQQYSPAELRTFLEAIPYIPPNPVS